MTSMQQIIDDDCDVRLLDGHLVDVQGTLLSAGGKLNEDLYNSMLQAHENGEKIYIYSSLPNTHILKDAGIDTEKFAIIPKSLFRSDGYSEVPYTIVTGRVIDDQSPENMRIILTNPKGWIYPNKTSYAFERDEMPEDMSVYYRKKLEKRRSIEMRRARQSLKDPLEDRASRFKRAEREMKRDIAREAFEEERKRNPDTTMTRADFERELNPTEKALAHLRKRFEEREMNNQKVEDSPRRSRRKMPYYYSIFDKMQSRDGS